MSSHHIIRDEQEPALILADLDAFPLDLLGQLLEWAPYTICGPEALNQVLGYEINVDEVYSADEGVAAKTLHFPGIRIISDETNWQANAIDHLAVRGHNAVNVVVSGSFDDFELMDRFADRMLVDIITPTMKYVLVEKHFAKWLPANSRIIVSSPQDCRVWGGQLSGNDITMLQDGMVEISAERPIHLGIPH